MSTVASNIYFSGKCRFREIELPASAVRDANIPAGSEIGRTKLAKEEGAEYPINFCDLLIFDALHTRLGSTPTSDDDLAITAAGKLTTTNLVGTSKTRKCAFDTVVPVEFVAGGNFKIRLSAKMVGSTGNVSATADVEAFVHDEEGGLGSDICTTVAQDINFTTKTAVTFDLDNSALSPGKSIHVRITLAVNDTGGAGSCEAVVGAIKRLVDIRG